MEDRRRGYVWLLGNPEYVGLLTSNLVSIVGDQLARVALIVLVYQRTDSPLLAAATYAATLLPVVIGAPLLGGFADRMPRRRVLVSADLARAGLFALMALPAVPIWVLLILLVLAVTVEAPYNAARGPLLREILVDDEGYQRGTSVDETLFQSGQVIGFATAGVLLTVFTPSSALVLDSLSFLLAAIVIRLLVRHRDAADNSDASRGAPTSGRVVAAIRKGLADAQVGFRAAMAPECRRPLLLTWAGISLAIAPEALAVPWAEQLGAGSVGAGLLFAAAPIGGVVGLLLAGRTSVERGQRLLLPLAAASLVPLVLAPAAPTLPWALGLVFLSGLGTTYSMLARVAFVRGVDNAHRGRAFAVAAAGVTAGQGLGIALAGGMASLISPAWSITLAGALGLALVTLVAISSPAAGSAQRLDSPVEKPSVVINDEPPAWDDPPEMAPTARDLPDLVDAGVGHGERHG
jgi:MFS family permease